MSSLPTLTRFATMLAFAGFSLHVATLYQLMQDGAHVSGTFNTVVAVSAAVAGWRIAGPRIEKNVLASVFAVLQGMIVAILLAAIAGATSETFRLGYKVRYNDLGDAMQGFFGFITDSVRELAVPDLLFPMVAFCLTAGLLLSVLYRVLEARRLA
ncbi:MAG: TrgA family protein [Rhodobacteraceae bacterium]|nr:TrgA family protein [Paracoccaceae bacterium]